MNQSINQSIINRSACAACRLPTLFTRLTDSYRVNNALDGLKKWGPSSVSRAGIDASALLFGALAADVPVDRPLYYSN